jgi:DNA-binding transcriptional MerR regulator
LGRGTGPSTVKLYYRIGEVAGIVGVEPHVLRYWETEFPTIRPQKSRSGQRVYSRRDVDKLLRVKELLYAQRFTIAGARQRLRDGTFEPLPSVARSEEIAEADCLEPTESAVSDAFEKSDPIASGNALEYPHKKVDTAVDSAVVAHHHAAQSLRTALLSVRSDVSRLLDSIERRRATSAETPIESDMSEAQAALSPTEELAPVAVSNGARNENRTANS